MSCRAQHYGQEARSVSPADQQVDDVKGDFSTRARDKAEDTYREGKEKGMGVWGSIQDFFGMFSCAAASLVGCLLMNMSLVGRYQGCREAYADLVYVPSWCFNRVDSGAT